jgi:hypothetical protein
MAASTAAFESWLTEKLLSLNPDTDTDVFVSYITGILDEDSSSDEKKESITELIGQVVVMIWRSFGLKTFRLSPTNYPRHLNLVPILSSLYQICNI